MENLKTELPKFPDGIYKMPIGGHGCKFCYIYRMNNQQALTHDCEKSRARISKMATDPGERNGGFYRQCKAKHL